MNHAHSTPNPRRPRTRRTLSLIEVAGSLLIVGLLSAAIGGGALTVLRIHADTSSVGDVERFAAGVHIRLAGEDPTEAALTAALAEFDGLPDQAHDGPAEPDRLSWAVTDGVLSLAVAHATAADGTATRCTWSVSTARLVYAAAGPLTDATLALPDDGTADCAAGDAAAVVDAAAAGAVARVRGVAASDAPPSSLLSP